MDNIELQDKQILAQEALIKAVDNYNPKLGFSFLMYVYPIIVNEVIIEAMKEQGKLYYKEKLLKKLNRIYEDYKKKNNIVPSEEELMQILSLDKFELNDLIKYRNLYNDENNTLIDTEENISIEDGVYTDSYDKFIDISEVEKIQNKDLIISCLDFLNIIERNIIELKFGLNNSIPLSIFEISKKLSISKEKVRQIESKALRKIKKCVKKESSKNIK